MMVYIDAVRGSLGERLRSKPCSDSYRSATAAKQLTAAYASRSKRSEAAAAIRGSPALYRLHSLSP
jgi:hypothetical protein